ncbi:hypothetical protein RhiirA5_443723 [Rhizophagus irregularis]|uniref:Uncharacterized protein n=1 Tax=Rhizophagus irregularis TaxID=588596 RepID=A0A2N0NDR5_9GLOM|nr:hypothetical protein RhiirA5_443723 [Rhizophagus irregularis]
MYAIITLLDYSSNWKILKLLKDADLPNQNLFEIGHSYWIFQWKLPVGLLLKLAIVYVIKIFIVKRLDV